MDSTGGVCLRVRENHNWVFSEERSRMGLRGMAGRGYAVSIYTFRQEAFSALGGGYFAPDP